METVLVLSAFSLFLINSCRCFFDEHEALRKKFVSPHAYYEGFEEKVPQVTESFQSQFDLEEIPRNENLHSLINFEGNSNQNFKPRSYAQPESKKCEPCKFQRCKCKPCIQQKCECKPPKPPKCDCKRCNQTNKVPPQRVDSQVDESGLHDQDYYSESNSSETSNQNTKNEVLQGGKGDQRPNSQSISNNIGSSNNNAPNKWMKECKKKRRCFRPVINKISPQ